MHVCDSDLGLAQKKLQTAHEDAMHALDSLLDAKLRGMSQCQSSGRHRNEAAGPAQAQKGVSKALATHLHNATQEPDSGCAKNSSQVKTSQQDREVVLIF